MHGIQQKIIKLAEQNDLSGLTLRKLGVLIGETGSPQKIKHHLSQLAKKGLVVIDKDNGTISKVKGGCDTKGKLYSLPIMGNANCGEAACFADNRVEGYLSVTKNVLGDLIGRVNDLFVVRAIGESMNKASIQGNVIEDGDYVIIDKSYSTPVEGDYVLSIINDVANIKKLVIDKENHQYILISQSNKHFAPIYIHKKDLDQYFIAGKVVKIMKTPDNWDAFMNAGAKDTLKALGSISKEETDYYDNL